MGDTWVADMRHYLDDEGTLSDRLPGPALNLALFLGSIVGWVTSHEPRAGDLRADERCMSAGAGPATVPWRHLRAR
jgi:hypothetical protein